MTDAERKVVPFGKYRGQPLEVLQADPGYVEWLRGQDWLGQKYPTFQTLIINNFREPDETPEHNALQVCFLDERFQRQVWDTWRQGLHATMRPGQRLGLYHGDGEHQPSRVPFAYPAATETSSVFEQHGIDVLLTVHWRRPWYEARTEDEKFYHPNGSYSLDEKAFRQKLAGQINWERKREWLKRAQEEGRDPYLMPRPAEIAPDDPQVDVVFAQYTHTVAWTQLRWEEITEEDTLALEIKPSLGDDYPAVLRQINAQRTRDHARGDYHWKYILLIQSFAARGATLDQLRQIFALSNVTLLAMADIDATTT